MYEEQCTSVGQKTAWGRHFSSSQTMRQVQVVRLHGKCLYLVGHVVGYLCVFINSFCGEGDDKKITVKKYTFLGEMAHLLLF